MHTCPKCKGVKTVPTVSGFISCPQCGGSGTIPATSTAPGAVAMGQVAPLATPHDFDELRKALAGTHEEIMDLREDVAGDIGVILDKITAIEKLLDDEGEQTGQLEALADTIGALTDTLEAAEQPETPEQPAIEEPMVDEAQTETAKVAQ